MDRIVASTLFYRKDTEPLYYSFMYSRVLLLCSIYPLPVMHSLLVTLCDGMRAHVPKIKFEP